MQPGICVEHSYSLPSCFFSSLSCAATCCIWNLFLFGIYSNLSCVKFIHFLSSSCAKTNVSRWHGAVVSKLLTRVCRLQWTVSNNLGGNGPEKPTSLFSMFQTGLWCHLSCQGSGDTMIKFISYRSLLRDLRFKKFRNAGLTNGAAVMRRWKWPKYSLPGQRRGGGVQMLLKRVISLKVAVFWKSNYLLAESVLITVGASNSTCTLEVQPSPTWNHHSSHVLSFFLYRCAPAECFPLLPPGFVAPNKEPLYEWHPIFRWGVKYLPAQEARALKEGSRLTGML